MTGVLRGAVVRAALLALLVVPCLASYLVVEHALPHDAVLPRLLIVAALLTVATVVFPRLQVAAHERLDTALVRWSADARRVLTRAIGEVATASDPEALVAILRTRLEEALQVEDTALWVRDPSVAVYRAVGAAAATPIGDAEGRALDRWIERAGGRANAPSTDAAARPLALLGGALQLPLAIDGTPLGVLVVGPRAGARPFVDADVALLRTLASQVASAVEHARLCASLDHSKRILERTSGLLAVGTVAAGLAHEIRNPLVAVQTFLQILPERLDDPEVTGEFRTVALDELHRVSKLIGDLLGMTRAPGVRRDPVDLEDVVDQAVRLLRVTAERADVELRRGGQPLPMAWADAPRLKQALLNLVLNAIQASPPRGVVTVTTCTGVDPNGRRFAEVAVRDQGAGIPAPEREAIFDPFFTTKDGGTGLGLAMTRQIVLDHGGTIHVASDEGVGSTFFLHLPLDRPADAATPRAAERAA